MLSGSLKLQGKHAEHAGEMAPGAETVTPSKPETKRRAVEFPASNLSHISRQRATWDLQRTKLVHVSSSTAFFLAVF